MDLNFLKDIPQGNYAKNFYDLNYDVSRYFILHSRNVIYIGPKRERECRFCLKKEGEGATFKNVAHAIPELLGNKTLVSGYECDECNTYFGETIEHQLGAYTKVYRGISAISGKKRIPKLGSVREGWSINSNEAGLNIVHHEENKAFHFDRENRTASFRVRRDPYVPLDVYKALVKIGVSIAPDAEAPFMQEAASWVRYGARINPSPCYVSMTFVEGWRPLKCLAVILLKRKFPTRELPKYMFVISLSNISLQIAIPCSQEDAHIYGKKVKFPPFPTPYEYGYVDYPVNYRTLDLSGTNRVINDFEELHIRFESVEEIRDLDGNGTE